jgi:hypothetical protein
MLEERRVACCVAEGRRVGSVLFSPSTNKSCSRENKINRRLCRRQIFAGPAFGTGRAAEKRRVILCHLLFSLNAFIFLWNGEREGAGSGGGMAGGWREMDCHSFLEMSDETHGRRRGQDLPTAKQAVDLVLARTRFVS